jgi:alkaline phosphatase
MPSVRPLIAFALAIALVLPFKARAGESATPARGVRNIILLIGDGMGPQEVNLLSLFARYAPSSTAPNHVCAIEQLINEGSVGVVRVEPYGAMAPR